MLQRISVVVAVLFLLGCVNAKQTYNEAANKHINSIAVIEPANPEEISVHIIHHPGANFGLIGGLVAAADISSKTAKYQESITNVKIDWSKRAQERIIESLEKSGYQVTSISKEKREPGKYLETYEGASVDAYLDYHFFLSYAATSPTTDYTPSVQLSVRLVEAKSKTILYEDQIAYGYHHTFGEPVHIPSSNDYLYADIETLCTNGIKSVDAFKEGIHLAVDRVASHLKKGGIKVSQQSNVGK